MDKYFVELHVSKEYAHRNDVERTYEYARSVYFDRIADCNDVVPRVYEVTTTSVEAAFEMTLLSSVSADEMWDVAITHGEGCAYLNRKGFVYPTHWVCISNKRVGFKLPR